MGPLYTGGLNKEVLFGSNMKQCYLKTLVLMDRCLYKEALSGSNLKQWELWDLKTFV